MKVFTESVMQSFCKFLGTIILQFFLDFISNTHILAIVMSSRPRLAAISRHLNRSKHNASPVFILGDCVSKNTWTMARPSAMFSAATSELYLSNLKHRMKVKGEANCSILSRTSAFGNMYNTLNKTYTLTI